MAVRPIDGSRFAEILEQWKKDCLQDNDQQSADVISDVILQLDDMPTLTPPNETPPCYQPDGDGCAYQCYDGQDEPIDKCKECPLCYSDKQRQHTPPNEWVSVYDRLPEPGERVLATDCGFVGEFYINKRGKWQRYNVNCSELLMALDILYWMPLPKSPKEDE